MPGEFSKANRPPRPGTYVNFVADSEVVVLPAIGSIVAVPFTADWGPYKEPVTLNSLADYRAAYGSNTQTPGYIAVQQAFRGEAVPNFAGAGVVLAYRFGGSSAAKASKILLNSAATPVAGVTLTALYEGSRGNNFRVTIETNADDALLKDLVLLEGTVELERYTYTPTVLVDLVAAINAASNFVTATLGVDGVALTTVSGSAFTGGDDGTTVASGDWTDVMDALETERFSLFSPFDLTDSGILASLLTWVQDQNAAGKRFMAVIGGASDEDVDDAIDRSEAMADWNIVNVGIGHVVDDGLLDANGDPRSLSTSQLAPRIAGILAARGEAMSLTFARLAGLTLVNGGSEADIRRAFDAGVTVLSRDSNIAAPVRIEKGLTTFTDTTDDDHPYVIYRTPKYVRTMGGLQTDLQEWADSNVIGKLPVNNKTRDFVLGEARSRLLARETASVIQPGWTCEIDTDPPPSDDDEFIALLIGLRFGRSVEQVYLTIKVG
jgi:hypothetical protein